MAWWGWVLLILAWLFTEWTSARIDELQQRVRRLEEASRNGWKWTPP